MECKCPCHTTKGALCGIDACCFESGKLHNTKRVLVIGETTDEMIEALKKANDNS